MLSTTSLLPFVLLLSTQHRPVAYAQSSGTISVGPLLTCDITTFGCPSGGCCTIGGCCGSGCCANGYTCINEGTSSQACCPVLDPTGCGTIPPADSDSGSDDSGDSGSGGNTCTQISNCRDSATGQTWPCLLGQTCGFSYRGCNPCPYAVGGGGDGSGDSGGSDSDSGSGSGSGSESESGPSGDSGSDEESPAPTPSSGSGTDAPGNSAGYRSKEAGRGWATWLAAAVGVAVGAFS